MPRHDDPMDLKAYVAAALIGLTARTPDLQPPDALAAEALKIGHATRAKVRAQLDAEERQAEREAHADREDPSRT